MQSLNWAKCHRFKNIGVVDDYLQQLSTEAKLVKTLSIVFPNENLLGGFAE
jgi:hypothetical protein